MNESKKSIYRIRVQLAALRNDLESWKIQRGFQPPDLETSMKLALGMVEDLELFMGHAFTEKEYAQNRALHYRTMTELQYHLAVLGAIHLIEWGVTLRKELEGLDDLYIQAEVPSFEVVNPMDDGNLVPIKAGSSEFKAWLDSSDPVLALFGSEGV